MKSRLTSRAMWRTAAALAIGTLLLVATPTPASARNGASSPGVISTCPANSFCLYQDSDFRGQMLAIPAGSTVLSLHAYACPVCNSPRHGAGDGNFGDQMSSWSNNTSTTFCWFFDINLNLSAYTMRAQHSESFTGGFYNDEASSLMPC